MTDDAEATRPPTPPSPFVNVLVVDDLVANREAMDALLRPLGYAVYLAGSGQEALHVATRFRLGVILLDVRMPGLDGLETALLLRRKPFTRTTPILFVSAYEDAQLEVSRSPLEGLVDFIDSPINPEIVAWKVRTWVDLYIRHELLRRNVTRLTEAQSELHQLLGKTPVPEEELREIEARQSGTLKRVIESLSDWLGITT
jgi:CheY-like chemotaxis protein